MSAVTSFYAGRTNGFKRPDDSRIGRVGRGLRPVERDTNVRLRGKVANLVRSDVCDGHQSRAVAEVSVVEGQACVR